MATNSLAVPLETCCRERNRFCNNLEEQIRLAREDQYAFTDLVEANRSFILHSASESVHHYVSDSDDEWSVALLAFSEAVRSYERGKGSFRGFAALVIRRRLLDWFRGESRKDEIAVTPRAFEGDLDEDSAGGMELEVQRRMTEEAEAAPEDAQARTREEIASVQRVLGGYGFSFFDLADCSPRAEKTKHSCALAVQTLLREPTLLAALRRTKAMPMKELSKASGVSRKILDRHRRYLIAAAEILSGDYPTLSSYMGYIRKVSV